MSALASTTIQCIRCRINVPETALALLNRCLDPFCPLQNIKPEPAEKKEAA